jgi:hypothetical protein
VAAESDHRRRSVRCGAILPLRRKSATSVSTRCCHFGMLARPEFSRRSCGGCRTRNSSRNSSALCRGPLRRALKRAILISEEFTLLIFAAHHRSSIFRHLSVRNRKWSRTKIKFLGVVRGEIFARNPLLAISNRVFVGGPGFRGGAARIPVRIH